jgi:recombination protein RecA
MAKTKDKPAPSGVEKTSVAIADVVRKEHGANSVTLAGSGVIDRVDFIPSGALALDAAMGLGGYPRGRIVEIFGPEASGKTTLTLHAIANVQKVGGVAAFIDAEHALDPKYATAIGVNMSELLLSQPDYGEQALDIAETLVRTGGVQLIVIDSVAALVPKSELEGDMGEPQMGVHARLMSQALRKLTAIASKTQTTLIFINQLRSKIGVLFGSPETTTGGNALKFYASMRLDVRRKEQLKDAEQSAIGNMMKVKVLKNKHAPPFKEADLEIVWGKGIDAASDLLTAAVNAGIVQKSGAWYAYGDDRLGQGFNAAARNLWENPVWREEVTAAVRKDLLI